MYGILGFMLIVLMSFVKFIFNIYFFKLNLSVFLIIMIIVLLVLVLFIFFFIELIEYWIEYNDIMNIFVKDILLYLLWKFNFVGSIFIMVSLLLFMLMNNIVNFIGCFIVNYNFEIYVFNFINLVGIIIYFLL